MTVKECEIFAGSTIKFVHATGSAVFWMPACTDRRFWVVTIFGRNLSHRPVSGARKRKAAMKRAALQ